MPDSVSDSYDPEFGTAAKAEVVKEGIRIVLDRVSKAIGDPTLRPIQELCRQEVAGEVCTQDVQVLVTERELRIIRFCMNTTLEAI